ncbi:MAG: tRNA-dihydrouridine synthase family protein [Lentisphaerae bacterium]|jgi:tRNA-dihydrouridine synthase B|nr:tRNA-dihydrouridine synthase family protein [Lentisphaerota bacterium]MBT4823499.1 tRNA-dihydrouridine synthase family protein [Lentisphaerota bacterium]MBT5612859.1 tRNA-dihydrouridine synthase family protein [Lentisphaerota bacterium]MBT7054312.1 tRNA-dihydrouridine synthase family protein [Lentisphaerota bacterium]MBT7842338.1 tRNA-dihydrouridine synthase family protein [Lentisphaerota bacterium]
MDAAAPKLVLAPIRGITDCIYRTALQQWFPGFDRAVSPFIQLRRGHSLRPGDVRQLAPENNRVLPVTPQVLTNHAETFTQGLRQLRDLGYAEANWNLGCPSPTVAGRGRGAGLLPHPDRIRAILDAVFSTSTVRLSVKLRLGRHDPSEATAVLAVLNRYPLSEVILHPRTADQLYDGELDIPRTREALSACRHPFVLSGGVSTMEGFTELSKQLPEVSAWMIGRGALSCPSLPARIKGKLSAENGTSREALRGFHDELFAGYSEWLSGPGHLLAKMTEHWVYLSTCFARPKHVFVRIRRSRDPERFRENVEWAFEQPMAPVMR